MQKDDRADDEQEDCVEVRESGSCHELRLARARTVRPQRVNRNRSHLPYRTAKLGSSVLGRRTFLALGYIISP